MNAIRLQHLLFVSLASCAGAALAQQPYEPPVPVNTEGLPLHVAAHVKEKAAQGATALRRYVEISRCVNQLDFRSLVRASDEPATQAAQDTPLTVAALNEGR